MSEVIMNEDGVGFVKECTPNLKLVIPYFDIATWHDYIDYNFKTLDAMINYIYKVVGFTGEWKKVTTYKVDDFVFINDPDSEYYLKMAKIVVEHTTTNDNFDTFYGNHEDYYEIYDEHIITNGIRIVKVNQTLTLSANQPIQIDLTQYTNENKSYYCIINYSTSTDVTKLSNVCSYNKTTRTVTAENHNTEQTTVKVDFIMLIPVDKLVGFNNNINGLTNGLYQVDHLVKQSQLTEETTVRQNADNAIINSIGNGTITLTQGGVTKGTFTTNQSENATINLDAGGDGGVASSIIIRNIAATSFNNTPATASVPAIYFANINVSAYVENGKKYMPFVVYESDGGSYSRLDIIKNMASDCYYQSSGIVSLRFYNEDVWHNAKYNIFLLEVEDNTNYAIRGMTNGLDSVINNTQTINNLITSLSSSSTDVQYPSAKCVYDALQNINTDKSIYLKNQTMTFAVNSGNAFLDVSNYVEDGVAYCPIVFIHAADRSITPQATYSVTNKYVYLNRNSAYASVQNTVTVDVCLIPVDTNETDINGLSDGLYYAQYLFINKSDITTNITSSSTDTQVPSAKCVYDIIGNIETLLQNV